MTTADELTSTERIAVLALRVVGSVNPRVMRDNDRAERASRTKVDPWLLILLRDELEKVYPGALAEIIEASRCTRCNAAGWERHDHRQDREG